MAANNLTDSVEHERIELTRLKVSVEDALSDLCMADVRVNSMRDETFNRMVYQLRAHVLADHIDDRTYDYEEITFPRWLKWAKRFCQVVPYRIEADAYHTYPRANVKMPELGKEQYVFNIQKLRRPRFV